MTDNSGELLKQINTLNKKLDDLITITAIGLQKEKFLEGKIQKDQIIELNKLGLSRNIISIIVGTTPLTVSVTLSQTKKERKKNARGK